MTKWAILEPETKKVIAIVESEERPENSVKGHDITCKIGWVFNGWSFDSPKWTSYEFLIRFTENERAAIRNYALTDPGVADFLMLAQAAQEIISDDPITIAGMDYLVSLNIITNERRDEILE
jgi:hypothetical protein